MFGMISQMRVGELDFQFRRSAVAEAFLGLAHHRLADLRVIVPHDHRAPGQHVVRVALAVDIEHVGAIGAIDEHGCAADGLEGANG
jgi:hypothetical protein